MPKPFSTSSMRLWQLVSPALPVGAFAYSQGLEYAVEAGWVRDEPSANEWILGQARNNLAALDVPVFLRMYDAWQHNLPDKISHWNATILALRESYELHQEDCHLGNALTRLLKSLGICVPAAGLPEIAFVTPYSFACQHWAIDKLEAAHGLGWVWCENQVAAAIKLVPLGQTAGQRILAAAAEAIALSVEQSLRCDDKDIGMLAPGMAVASALHETQYTRIFRS